MSLFKRQPREKSEKSLEYPYARHKGDNRIAPTVAEIREVLDRLPEHVPDTAAVSLYGRALTVSWVEWND